MRTPPDLTAASPRPHRRIGFVELLVISFAAAIFLVLGAPILLDPNLFGLVSHDLGTTSELSSNSDFAH